MGVVFWARSPTPAFSVQNAKCIAAALLGSIDSQGGIGLAPSATGLFRCRPACLPFALGTRVERRHRRGVETIAGLSLRCAASANAALEEIPLSLPRMVPRSVERCGRARKRISDHAADLDRARFAAGRTKAARSAAVRSNCRAMLPQTRSHSAYTDSSAIE